MTTPEVARLYPFDGMFLRAIHLEQIQRYTQALAHALGQAGGPGIVYGYGLTLAADGLHVAPGLAIAADGRVLLSETTILEQLPDPGDTLAWRVDLVPEEHPFGQENAYGDICIDPCAGTSFTAPFIGEGVAAQLTALTLSPDVDAGSPSFRNRVASGYFEEERRKGGPMIAASDRDTDPAATILRTGWASPTGVAPGPVAIGLLLRSKDGFSIDVWAARRDRIQNPPQTGWLNRLGMRPWAVFQAQLLQFLDQLTSVWPGSAGPVMADSPVLMSVRAQVHGRLTTALDLMRAGKRREPSDLLEDALTVLAGDEKAAPVISLRDLGFDDLPPAGYLPARPGSIYDRIPPLFPADAIITINAYRADVIVELVSQAQHLDRIPLSQAGGGPWPPRIEIMVPVPEPYTDGHDLQTVRSWVAFRRSQHVPSILDDNASRGDGPAATDTDDGATQGNGDNGNGGGLSIADPQSPAAAERDALP